MTRDHLDQLRASGDLPSPVDPLLSLLAIAAGLWLLAPAILGALRWVWGRGPGGRH